ncbi:BBE domain-containing protein [Asanoa sp. NPDC049518]|uniref:BBE domain-containing protein n=1 Tax=unclassified Asanoa TaxID=2685164 RepID=UPI0034365C03
MLRRVTPDSDPDLFFALLGGKGNVGVVTALEFSLFPVTELYAGSLQFAGEHAAEVLRAYRTLTATAPDELTSSVVLLHAPDLPFVPELMRGKLSVFVRLAYLGADGDALVAPLRAAAPVLVDAVGTMSAGDIAVIGNDPTDPATSVEHFAMLDELSPAAIDAILELAGPDAAKDVTLVNLTQLGGAFARPPRHPNAVRRDVAFALFALTVVPPGAPPLEGQRDRGLELTRRLTTPDSPKHPGYLAPSDATVEGVRKAYDRETYERLRTAKSTWDPQNMFRWNYNVPPRV